MIVRTAAQVADLAQATLTGDGQDLVGPDVVIDSRLAQPGSLFVALPGEQVDGHDFTGAAAAAGASAVLASRTTEAAVPHLLIDDPVAGLSWLARGLVAEAVAERGLLTLAITGSAGKTSTKDIVAQLLEAQGPTVAPVGSFNNEIGVPLTAARIDEHTRYLVSEMGARGQGHLRWLCSLVPPQISVVLNVGSAHLGEFGSVEGIAQAKGELVEALPADGWAVLNADDPRVVEMAQRTQAQLVWFSTADELPEFADAAMAEAPMVWADDIRLDDLQRASFLLTFTEDEDWYSRRVQLPLLGRHMVNNAVAAAAAAWRAGVEMDTIVDVLERLSHRSPWRMELVVRSDGAAVINDAYNANPDSMRAALAALGPIGAERKRRWPQARTMAVLGDMVELGAESAELHRRVGELAAAAGVDDLIAIGDHAEYLLAGARAAGLTGRVASVAEASSLDLGAHDVVLVKASRAVALERVAMALSEGPAHGE